MTTYVLGLLFIFQLKHFVADYPLQNKYMLGKFKADWSFLGPLTAHCLVHAYLTFIISLWVFHKMTGWEAVCTSLGIAFFDFSVHFVMDRIKAGPRYLGRFNDATKPFFWWSLGFDQMVHHLIHYLIIFALLLLKI